MSVDKHFEKRGVALTEDNSLPSGQRTQRNVKRLIAAVRAAESEFNDELRDANERCRIAQDRVIALTERCHKLEDIARRYLIAERLNSIEALTTADRKLLLEASVDPDAKETIAA